MAFLFLVTGWSSWDIQGSVAVHHPWLWFPCALSGAQDPLPLSLLLPAMPWSRRTFPRALKAGKPEVKLFTSSPNIYHGSNNKTSSGIQLAGGGHLGWDKQMGCFCFREEWVCAPKPPGSAGFPAAAPVGSTGFSPHPLQPVTPPCCEADFLIWEEILILSKSFSPVLCLTQSLPPVLFLQQLLNQTHARLRSLKGHQVSPSFTYGIGWIKEKTQIIISTSFVF